MAFLLGLGLTPIGAFAGTLVLILIGAQGLEFHPLALLVGVVMGSFFAAPVTILVLPYVSHAIDGAPYDRPVVHASVGLVTGTAWMLDGLPQRSWGHSGDA